MIPSPMASRDATIVSPPAPATTLAGRVRLDRHELAGSLGDMGTYIPFLVGMVRECGLNPASALFFSGLFNIITGLAFGIPMAVQPMKAIGTIAIAEHLTVEQILAAGIVTSAVIFTLGVTGLIEWLNRVIPFSVVRGLQLGLGLQLLINGIGMVTKTGWANFSDSIYAGLACALLILLFFFHRRVPGALVVFGLGLILVALNHPEVWRQVHFGLSLPAFMPLAANDFKTATMRAVVPQIPLTTLNSVIAVCALSWDLFPQRGATPKKVAMSVGAMNLIGCWFGAMPMCHGAGGLAGQHRFGARTGGSVVMLGVAKMLLGLTCGAAAFKLMSAYPSSVLGTLLAFSGMELALVTRDVKTKTDTFVMLLTASVILALKNTASGFAIGLALAYLFIHGVLRVEQVEESTNP